MDTDFLLVMKMKQGDEEAFDKFVRKYYGEILKYCKYHCFDTEYAMDLAQETFFHFFTSLSEYHYKGKTKNYLYTIAGNLCKNYYKKKKEAPMEGEGLETAFVLPVNPLDTVVERVTVETAINKLSGEFKEVVILYYFQGLKLMEIADVLKIGLPLVKYRLGQARKRLKQMLEHV